MVRAQNCAHNAAHILRHGLIGTEDQCATGSWGKGQGLRVRYPIDTACLLG